MGVIQDWEYTNEEQHRLLQRRILEVFASGSPIAKLMGRVMDVKAPKSPQEIAEEERKKREAEAKRQRAREIKAAAEAAIPVAAKPKVSITGGPVEGPETTVPLATRRGAEEQAQAGRAPFSFGAGIPSLEEWRGLPKAISETVGFERGPLTGARPAFEEMAHGIVAGGPTVFGWGTEAVPALETVGYGLLRYGGRAGKAVEAAPGRIVEAIPKLAEEAARPVRRLVAEEAGGGPLGRAGEEATGGWTVIGDEKNIEYALRDLDFTSKASLAESMKTAARRPRPAGVPPVGGKPPPPAPQAFAEYEAAGAEERILGGLRGGEPPGRKPPTQGELGGMPPEEPKGPRLPTMRDVEARSKPLPPEVRAELGGQPPAMRFELEPFETVSQRWGNRFVENWWTKVEDLIGGKIKAVARTPEEIAVRSAFIKRDIYAATQGDSMRAGVLEWQARNRKILGLNGRGQAKAVQVVSGAEIPKGLEQRLMHIIEHPEKYVITPEQQTALKEATDRFAMMLQRQQAEGVNIREWQEGYWHRIVTKRPTAEPGRMGVGGGRLGARPSAARMRVFGDIEDAWNRGYRYANDIDAMMAYGQDAAAAVADRNTVRTVQNLGFKPSEKVDPAIIQELTEARQGYKATRAAASKKGATTAERASALEADVRLDNAMRAMRLESRRWAERQPKVFGRIVSPEVAQEFTRYVGDLPEGTIDQVFQLLRANMIWGDLSAAGVQTQSLIWRDPVSWLKATTYSVRALASEPTSYILKNPDAIESGIRFGAIRAPDEYLLRTGKGLAHRFGQLPGVKQTQSAFEWDVFVAQTERWKAVQRMAKTPDDLLELAAEIRAQTGTALMPGLTRAQAKWMGRTWFAGRFLTSTLAVFKNATRGGVAGHEARRTLLQIFGGVAATTAAANIALTGKPGNFTDPDKPGFLGVRLGEGFVYLYGPFHPLLVAAARTSRAAAMVAQGERPSNRDLQAMPRLVEGKLSLPYRVTTQALEALGVPLEAIRGEPYEEPKIVGVGGWLRQLGEYAPIGPSQAVQGIKQGFYAAALEPLGVKTTPISPWAKLNELVPDWGGMIKGQREEEAKKNPEVRKWWDKYQEQGLARGQESAETQQTKTVEAEDFQSQILGSLNREGVTYSDINNAISDFLNEQRIKGEVRYAGIDFKADTEDKKLLDDWYGLYDSLPAVATDADYDALYEKQDEMLAANPRIGELIKLNHQAIFTDPTMDAIMAQRDAAQAVRRQYYAIPSKRGVSVQTRKVLDPYVDQIYSYMQLGMAQDEAFRRAGIPASLRGRLRAYMRRPANPARKRFKQAHPELQWFEDIPLQGALQPEAVGVG